MCNNLKCMPSVVRLVKWHVSDWIIGLKCFKVVELDIASVVGCSNWIRTDNLSNTIIGLKCFKVVGLDMVSVVGCSNWIRTDNLSNTSLFL